MTTSNHVYVGAIVGLSIQQPLLAIPLAFLSHFALDALPHYGYGPGSLAEGFKYKLTWVMEAVNIVALPVLAWLLWGAGLLPYVAGIAAISPDLVWIHRYFWYERKGLEPPIGWLTKHHLRLQWCERYWGIVIEYLFLMLLVVIVWRSVTW